MEPSKELTLEEIEAINRNFADRSALDLETYISGVEIPEEQIDLFAEQAKGKKMLDVGCGWAGYAARFDKLGFDYTGIDLSPNMVAISRSKNPSLRFEVMSFRKLDFPNETFDCLWSSCVLNAEPKGNVKNVLIEMKRVLKPGGIMLIILPDPGYSEEGIADELPTYGPRYRSVWEPFELTDVFESAELTVTFGSQQFESGSMTFIVQK